jgi:hypothetical protein
VASPGAAPQRGRVPPSLSRHEPPTAGQVTASGRLPTTQRCLCCRTWTSSSNVMVVNVSYPLLLWKGIASRAMEAGGRQERPSGREIDPDACTSSRQDTRTRSNLGPLALDREELGLRTGNRPGVPYASRIHRTRRDPPWLLSRMSSRLDRPRMYREFASWFHLLTAPRTRDRGRVLWPPPYGGGADPDQYDPELGFVPRRQGIEHETGPDIFVGVKP